MIAFGCYAEGLKDREVLITKACVDAGYGTPRFEHPDFLAATADALILAHRGVKVVIVGQIDDLKAPKQGRGYQDLEWRESWLTYLEAHGIAFHQMGGELRRAKGVMEHTLRTTVIRDYQRAQADLDKSMARLMNVRKREEAGVSAGYVCGRPPYGYSVEDGEFVVDPYQSDAVRLIFKHVRDGGSPAALLAVLRKKFSANGLKRDKPQYWDRVKLRRIMKHAALYCRGEYRSTGGHTANLPKLAFLPPEWEKPRPAGSGESIPSIKGSGTLGASAPSRRDP